MKNNTKKTLAIYLRAALRYKAAGFFTVFSIVAGSTVSIITGLFIAQFFNVLAVGDGGQTAISQLIRLIIILACLEGLAWIFWRMATFGTAHLQTRVIADLSNKSFQYLHKHSFTFFENNFVGSLVKRVNWFSRAFEVVADQIIWHLIPLFVNIAVIVVILFWRNFWLGIALLAWSILFLSVNYVFSRYKLKYDIDKARQETKTTAVLADTITNNKEVKLFNGYLTEVKRFFKVTDELRIKRKFTWNLNNIFEAAQGVLAIGLEIGLLYLALKLWQKNLLTVGDFALIQIYLIRILDHIWDFGRVLRKIYESLADAEEMTIILNAPHEIVDVPKAQKLKVINGEIEFVNVDFYYHQTRKVMDNFSLKIKSKERLALIGPSGAGKTTVVKLLLRMNEIDKGRILIDSQNIAKVNQESLRKSISLVPQNPILFHRTLMENIRYGKPTATDKEIIMAAKKAYCHQFISKFSQGYHTYVGERGVKLSGGERQRVAIARAILRDAPILILDEATSSLDSASEILIQKAMRKLMENKTVIVIAHRLSTIRQMDRIVVIDNGKIIEQGTHRKLISKASGKYKKLWELQAGGFDNNG